MPKTQLFTTLKLLKKADACDSGMKTLVSSLPKTHTDTKPINLLHILKSNGIDHFFWAFRATTKPEKTVKRLILHDIVKEVQPIYEKQFPESDIFTQVLKALRTGRGLEAAKDAASAAHAAASATRTDASAAYAARTAAYTAYTAGVTCATAYSAAYDADAAASAARVATHAADRTAVDAREKQIKIIKKYLK